MAGMHRSVLVEADGGSRGNPGKAAYGAVLMDAQTREVIAERAECIGIATNNVAEYSGLIAGLELFHQHTPEADLEVRMDSKLVVEQMSGRWKIKHPDMRPLASRAQALAPFGTTYTWIPRAQNAHADRILNEALDAQAGKRPRPTAGASTVAGTGVGPTTSTATTRPERTPARGWGQGSPATTLVLVRHGVTAHTVDKRFSGGLAGRNPGLTDEGRAQVRATADWLSPLADGIDVVVASPVRRTQESAEILGARLERDVVVEDGLAEMEFGTWEGLTFADVREANPDDLDRWLGSLDFVPGGAGESFRDVEKRVLASLDRMLTEHAGQTILAVSHVTPIKVLVAHALGAPLDSVFRMELAPASVTVLSFYADGTSSMRMFNGRPTEAAFLSR
jgi:broad specificity phosphatase PhoE/ribonuclease HI